MFLVGACVSICGGMPPQRLQQAPGEGRACTAAQCAGAVLHTQDCKQLGHQNQLQAASLTLTVTKGPVAMTEGPSAPRQRAYMHCLHAAGGQPVSLADLGRELARRYGPANALTAASRATKVNGAVRAATHFWSR